MIIIWTISLKTNYNLDNRPYFIRTRTTNIRQLAKPPLKKAVKLNKKHKTSNLRTFAIRFGQYVLAIIFTYESFAIDESTVDVGTGGGQRILSFGDVTVDNNQFA